MTRLRYTYTVLRYTHDRAAGETLNIGVLVLAPEHNFIGLELEPRFERLSRTFAGFDGDVYRQTLTRLRESVARLRPKRDDLFGLGTLPLNAPTFLHSIWPDLDLSFSCGPVLSGVTNEPLETVTRELFQRMVVSQAPGKGDVERRSDDDVWASTYQEPLRRARVSHHLVEMVLKSPDYEIKFDHAFRNAAVHAVQPVTMDFVRPEYLQEKATRLLGTGAALRGDPRLAKIYLLMGAPRLESHRNAYNKAKNLLHKMQVTHEIVEEQDAEAFAQELAEVIRAHGVGDNEPST